MVKGQGIASTLGWEAVFNDEKVVFEIRENANKDQTLAIENKNFSQ